MGKVVQSPVLGIGNFIPRTTAEKDILTNYILLNQLTEPLTIDKFSYTTKRVLYRNTAILFLHGQIYS
ncbi:hypothetical protein A4R26_05255 [Niastella populi]|uniref:Uncharacterized protein n=1 Tax=Niastella populi TaxID=550983 RepID=A0A1V9FDX2_9BACT|nr:hypothetical protein A4R26_05255 [Niastella populi]